jgi:hypothetical protein
MKISIPTLSGIKVFDSGLRDIVRTIENLAQELMLFTANGITVKENVSHEVVTVQNEGILPSWVTVKHSLRRIPLGVMLQKGGSAYILDVKLNERSAEFYLAGGSQLTLVLM